MKKIGITFFIALFAFLLFAIWHFIFVYDKKTTLLDEGAYSWFQDPRTLTYKEDGINKTYTGLVDVHGNIKALQYDNNNGKLDEILIRTNFSPNDHCAPSFLALKDGRIMIFYSRHTNEPRFFYRISKKKGDIRTFGEEKCIETDSKITYINPFYLEKDKNHIYLLYRGIDWHPTLAKILIPDENGDTKLLFEKQVIKTQCRRPYAKYASFGSDKIMVAYTAGHPDNMPTNPLYFGIISISDLAFYDIFQNKLYNLGDIPEKYKLTAGEDEKNSLVVDINENFRNWIFEVALAKDNNPVIAMVSFDRTKHKHTYYILKFNGNNWTKLELPWDGNTTVLGTKDELCASGGMSIDKDNPRIIYASLPVEKNHKKVWEIVRYTLNSNFTKIEKMEYITKNSKTNNIRPQVSINSKQGDLRLVWLNGFYEYWKVDMEYKKGFSMNLVTYDIERKKVKMPKIKYSPKVYRINQNVVDIKAPKSKEFTIYFNMLQDDIGVCGNLIESGNLKVLLENKTGEHYLRSTALNVSIGDFMQKSNNILSNCDWVLKNKIGTNGTRGVNNPNWINYAICYDGKNLTTYINGLIDINLQDVDVKLDDYFHIGNIKGTITNVQISDTCLNQAQVQSLETKNGIKIINNLINLKPKPKPHIL